MNTDSSAGLSPNFRGLGDVPLTSFTIGPGGQFAVSSVTTPTGTSLWDQFLSWMSASTFVPGMPNSVIAAVGVIGLLAIGRRR